METATDRSAVNENTRTTLGFSVTIILILLGAVAQYVQTRTAQEFIKQTVNENKATLAGLQESVTEILIRRQTFVTQSAVDALRERVAIIESRITD